MKIGETKVIDERETGNYMSGESWPEYLVLEGLKKGQFRLDTRRDEVIDEAHNYCAENGLIDDDGNITPPTQIDGKDVYVDDGYIYTDDLVQVEDDNAEVVFTSPDQDAVANWCKGSKWDYDRIIKSLVEVCGDSKQSSKNKPAKRKRKESKSTPKKDRSLSPEQANMLEELWKMRAANYKAYREKNSTSQSSKKSAKKKTTSEELLEPPGLGKSLSPEEAKMANDLYDLKMKTLEKGWGKKNSTSQPSNKKSAKKKIRKKSPTKSKPKKSAAKVSQKKPKK